MDKYPFPYNVQPSELDIKGNVLRVYYTLYDLKSQYGDIVIRYIQDTVLFEYNDKGQLVKFRAGNHELFGWSRFDYDQIYDEQGNSLSVSKNLEYFYENGKLAKVHLGLKLWRLHYANSILSKIDCYDYKSGQLESTSYYQNGNLVKTVTLPTSFSKKEEVETFTYRNHKLLNSNGKVYTYNDKGLYSPTGACKYSYEYDERGNWITRYEIEKDKYGNLTKGYLTVRKITYR